MTEADAATIVQMAESLGVPATSEYGYMSDEVLAGIVKFESLAHMIVTLTCVHPWSLSEQAFDHRVDGERIYVY